MRFIIVVLGAWFLHAIEEPMPSLPAMVLGAYAVAHDITEMFAKLKK